MPLEANQKKPSGLLHTQSSSDKFALNLYLPSAELELYVEHYWIVQWDLRGQEPYVSENLPHPSVHLVIEEKESNVVGIIKEKFSRLLREKGFVFGIKFRPGAFYPFVNTSVHTFTDQFIPAHKVFGRDFALFEEAIRSADDDDDMVTLAEDFIRGLQPENNDKIAWIKTMIDCITSNPAIVTVEDVASRFDTSTRMLQRLFKEYVGVGPKWVIQRYRLLEVADQLEKGREDEWTDFAIKLGFYDQSHFIRTFKSIVGCTPDEYMKKSSGRA